MIVTLATLQPLAFTVIFGLVDLALLLVLLGTPKKRPPAEAGGCVVLAFAAVGIYVFYGAASLATRTGECGYGGGAPIRREVGAARAAGRAAGVFPPNAGECPRAGGAMSRAEHPASGCPFPRCGGTACREAA